MSKDSFAFSTERKHALDAPLRHKTFAEELGQYEVSEGGALVDRFHGANRYFVAKSGDAVIGMISIQTMDLSEFFGRGGRLEHNHPASQQQNTKILPISRNFSVFK